MNARCVPAYDEASGRGTVRHAYTRRAVNTADAVLCIVTARFGEQTTALTDAPRAAWARALPASCCA